MTRFSDGPAAGRQLELERIPLFLRGCIDGAGNVDALDLLADEPREEEHLYAYCRVSDVGIVHIDRVDPKTGRRVGEWRRSANYQMWRNQPDEATMRDRQRWQAWCEEAYAKTRGNMGKTRWQRLTVAIDDEHFDMLRAVQTRLHLRSLSETVRVLIRWAHEQDKEQ